MVYPSPLFLNGVVLPWRESAVHLGHTLQASLSFSADAGVRRAAFISRSVEVRSQFAFAQPAQILKAVKTLCCDAYGSVLWRLDSPYASSFYSAYTSCVKRIYRLPVNTYSYLVEGHLSQGVVPLRNLVLGRYASFFQKMAWGPSREVTIMAELARNDARTTTAANLKHISDLTSRSCATGDWSEVKAALPVKEVPEKETWRLGLLESLLRERGMLEKEGRDTKRVIAMLASLCST